MAVTNDTNSGAAETATTQPNLPFGLSQYKWADLTSEKKKELCARPKIDFKATESICKKILSDIRERGDEVVIELTKKFDGAELTPETLVVKVADLPAPKLEEKITNAFDQAYSNIKTFHAAQKHADLKIETMPGVECRRVCRPIENVGIYVPGGMAVLPSTVLMLGIPAQLAGVTTTVLATPPDANGEVSPAIIYCAKKCGVQYILKAGGAQAVAAMAYGTKSCPKVDKVVGPGNQYVTCAKMLISCDGDAVCSIDMPAGPSEQMCLFDNSSNLTFVVADLLSQAEHSEDAQVVGVYVNDTTEGTPMNAMLEAFAKEVEKQVNALPRADIVKSTLSKSVVVTCETVAEALVYVNGYAPEHLVVQTRDTEKIVEGTINAGSIFCGPYAPESVGDYASGTNHSLPTYGYARQYGGVSFETFVKYITVQTLSAEGIQNVGPTVEIMADVEGLDAHRNAVTVRLTHLKENGATENAAKRQRVA